MAFLISLWHAFTEIFAAPFHGHRIWWQLAPVLILWLILEVYFVKNKREELGWNTALGNAITLFWISITALQQAFTLDLGEHLSWARITAVTLILLYSLFVGFISFGHKLGEEVTYVLAYPTTVYYLSVFAILWGSKALAANRYVFLAFVLLGALVAGVRLLIFWLSPDDASSS